MIAIAKSRKLRKVSSKPGKKTWAMKINDPNKVHQLQRLNFDFSDMHKGDLMLIATPKIVDTYIREIPKGKSVTLVAMRRDLAFQYGADNTCPLTTGIFLRIVSEAAHEAFRKGTSLSKITPFWRVVETRSPMNKKLTFGTLFVASQRKREHLDNF